jgi:hypothetical protein
MATPIPTNMSSVEIKALNNQEYIKRLAIESYKLLKTKPDASDIVAPLIQEIRAIPSKIAPPPPPVVAEPVAVEPARVGLRPRAWIALILILVIATGINVASQYWQAKQLEQNLGVLLFELHKDIERKK